MKTLYSKFTVYTLFIMVMSSILGFLITNTLYHQIIKEQNDDKYTMLVQNMTSYIEQHPPTSLDAYLTQLAQVGYQIYLVDDKKQSQFYGANFRLNEISPAIVDSVLAGEAYHGIKDYPQQLFITGFFSNDLKNTVGLPFTYNNHSYAMFVRLDIKLLFSEVHFILGTLLILIPLLSIIAMALAATYLIKPIQHLSAATKQVASENFDAYVELSRQDEIGVLARNFNDMTEELKKQRESQKNFIRNVSHDFQTPLQNIKGYAELIQLQSSEEPLLQEYSAIIKAEGNRLSYLTKQLLLWQTATKLVEQREVLSLDSLIKQIVQDAQWSLQQQQMTIWLELEEMTFLGNETLLTYAIENILSNAIKYGKKEGEIIITGQQKEGCIELVIQDNGIGIAPHNIDAIFEPFYRGDSSRTTEGTGLGLAIVKQAIDLLDGSIEVQSIEQQGTTFILRFPLQ